MTAKPIENSPASFSRLPPKSIYDQTINSPIGHNLDQSLPPFLKIFSVPISKNKIILRIRKVRGSVDFRFPFYPGRVIRAREKFQRADSLRSKNVRILVFSYYSPIYINFENLNVVCRAETIRGARTVETRARVRCKQKRERESSHKSLTLTTHPSIKRRRCARGTP